MINDNCNIEEWVIIKDYPFYQVSNTGKVKRVFDKKEYVLKLTSDKSGYIVCNINNKFGRKHKSVHRLVLETFKPTDDHTLEVNHKDCDKSNNNLYNLEWNTRKQNLEHAEQNGRMEYKKRSGKDSPIFGKKISKEVKAKMSKSHNKNGKHPNYILTDEQVLDIKIARYNGVSLEDLSLEYDKSKACISLICRGKRRSNIGVEYTIL